MDGNNHTAVIDGSGTLLEEKDDQGTTTSASGLHFVLVPKQTSSPFFQVVGEGCIDRGRVLSASGQQQVMCSFLGPEFANADEQAAMIQQLVTTTAEDDGTNTIDGLALAVTKPNHGPTLEAIATAIQKGIPVITFDSDDVTSQRLAYVGTDNFAFGQALAKVLLQIDPTGGSYALISSNAPNVQEREDGVRFRLRKSNWFEDVHSPGNCNDNATLSILQMRNFASSGVKAILPVGGWPMFEQGIHWSVFADDHPDVLTVCADTLPHQMDLLNRNKVGGLVGQIPFQMGANALDLLLQYHQEGFSVNRTQQVEDHTNVIYGTELHEVITVPLDLPPPDIDHHYIGNLRYLGIILWASMTLAALVCGVWTHWKRNHTVIRASQPFFLLMIVVGILLTIGTILPMSFVQETVNDDDEREAFLQQQNDKDDSQRKGVFVCTSPIWLISIGFTTVFSALFAKTWRINMIFHNPAGFSRLAVKAKDVLWPFVLMLLANVFTLALMTALAPLEYVRKDHEGTDAWNRVISTYGQCQSTTDRWGGAIPYLVILGLINLSVLVVAIIQAYQARSIQSEFSESHYIAVTMICILQTIVVAGPVLALVSDQPQALYVVMVCAVFVISAITLGCIFGPKIVNVELSSRGMTQQSTRRVSMRGAEVRVFEGSSKPNANLATGSGQTSGGVIDGTERSNTRSGHSGDNLDNSNSGGESDGLRLWISQVSEIEH